MNHGSFIVNRGSSIVNRESFIVNRESFIERTVTVFALLVVILSIPGLGHSAQSGGTADETAVRGVVKAYVDARDRSDAAAIRALFTDDADQLTSSGEWRKGREELVRGTLASSKGNPGTRTIAIETVRFPATGVAIADGKYEIAGSQGAEPRRMWTSFLMVRSEAGWRIAGIRNMLPAPAGR